MSARCSAERCRAELRNRIIFARWLGEQAVGVVRRELIAAWDAGRTSSAPAEPEDDAGEETPVAVVAVEPVEAPPPVAAPEVAPAVVPFEGYDTLPASHIVERLRRMPAGDLVAARRYEAAHRNRRTILAKVDQLLEA